MDLSGSTLSHHCLVVQAGQGLLSSLTPLLLLRAPCRPAALTPLRGWLSPQTRPLHTTGHPWRAVVAVSSILAGPARTRSCSRLARSGDGVRAAADSIQQAHHSTRSAARCTPSCSAALTPARGQRQSAPRCLAVPSQPAAPVLPAGWSPAAGHLSQPRSPAPAPAQPPGWLPAAAECSHAVLGPDPFPQRHSPMVAASVALRPCSDALPSPLHHRSSRRHAARQLAILMQRTSPCMMSCPPCQLQHPSSRAQLQVRAWQVQLGNLQQPSLQHASQQQTGSSPQPLQRRPYSRA